MTGRSARLLPSDTLIAMPTPAPRRPIACTPSAPIFATQSPRPGAHQLEIAAALARHHLRMRGHRVREHLRRASVDGVVVARGEARERLRQARERDRIVRRRAAVDAGDELGFGRRREVGDRRRESPAAADGRTRGSSSSASRSATQYASIPLCLPEQLFSSGEYGGGGADLAAHLVETRRVRAALQVGRDVACLGEHVGGRRDVPRLARMARAEQRDLRAAESRSGRCRPRPTNGIAWNGFSALRVIVRKPGSPAAYSRRPSRSTTATDPMCRLSTASPRMTTASGACPGPRAVGRRRRLGGGLA